MSPISARRSSVTPAITHQRRRFYAPGRFVNWCGIFAQARVPALMSESLPLTEGCYARVRLRPGCDGGGKPHHPAEDGARVLVTVIDSTGGHCAVGNYKGLPWSTVRPPPGGLGVGRYFRPDELEVLPPDRFDPTPEEYAERSERLRRAMLGA
jgi:hypothetical protein